MCSGGNMSPPLPDAKHDWVHGGQQEPDTGYENHSIAMHKAASDKVPLALLVPAAALVVAASHAHGTVCHSSAGKEGLCSFKVVTTLDPC
jgi:hypothetical protein